jgi:hypothetical protein
MIACKPPATGVHNPASGKLPTPIAMNFHELPLRRHSLSTYGEIPEANSYHALEAIVRRGYEQCQNSDRFASSPSQPVSVDSAPPVSRYFAGH